MSLGAFPLVFSNNMMYEARRNLGIVIIGGLLIGTFFSLIVVPVAYAMIKNAEDELAKLKGKLVKA